MTNSRLLAILLATAMLAGAGCSKKAVKTDDAMASDGTTTNVEQASDGMDSLSLTDPQSILANRVIYFDFDSSQVRSDFNDLLAAHGKYLSTHPDQKLTLEGHADERGSREYNIALGERRGQSVSQTLVLNGASASQINVISYGEEKAMEMGHEESSWSKNRRVEMKYAGY